MKTATPRAFVLLFIAMVCVGSAGCDLINPPKKQEAKSEPAKPAAVIDENAPLAADVVARVGSWTLTAEQFNQRLKLLKEGLPDFDANKPGNKEAVLDELIRQQLLVKEAEDTGIAQQQEIVEAVEDFRRTLMVQELAGRLTKTVSADEKDARKYYDENKKLFVSPIQWKVREIVVDDEATAKNILVQVLQGGDFAEIAKAQSKGKTASSGGVLPAFTTAPFEAMQTAIASLDKGSNSAVFKGPAGYYIVHVDEKKGGEAKAFDDVKKDLVTGLTLRKQQEAILKHLDELAQKTQVKINKDLLSTSGK